MFNVVPTGVGADYERGRPVRIDVVRAVLGVVFQHENRRFVPDRAVREVIDKLTQRQVIVGHMGGGGGSAHSGTARVVVAEADTTEMGYGVGGDERIKVFFPDLHPTDVFDAHVEIGVVSHEMTVEGRAFFI